MTCINFTLKNVPSFFLPMPQKRQWLLHDSGAFRAFKLALWVKWHHVKTTILWMKKSTSPRRITPVHGVWLERASSLWIPGGCHKPAEGQRGENDVLSKGLPRGEAAWAMVPACGQPVCQPLIRFVRLPELFHLIIRSLYLLTNISPFPPSPSSWQPLNSLFLWAPHF